MTQKDFGVTPKGFGMTSKAFRVTHEAFGVTRKGFGMTLKGFGVTPKDFRVTREDFGMTLKDFGMIPKGFRVTPKDFGVPREGLGADSVPARSTMISAMERRGQAAGRDGRIWEARVLSADELEEEDFRFWYEGLTPEERVRAVEDCLLSALKARGIDEIPRLRRVRRVLERKRR